MSVHIDRVVLRGIDPLDQRAFSNALQAELARVLAQPQTRAAIARSSATPVLRLGRMTMRPGQAGARALGNGVARAIGKGMAR
jgi:hypothetical protein